MNSRLLKTITSLLVVFIFFQNNAQNNYDIETPNTNSFELGKDISGNIQNSVNEATGKVVFSVPLGSVSAGPLSFGVNISYNSQNGFKTGREMNKYSPTSVVGVGWSFSTPKIVVDNKQTATREDDEFYIVQGGGKSKLICTDVTYGPGDTPIPVFMQFKAENNTNWKISYNIAQSFEGLDSWHIITEDGTSYYYGKDNSTISRDFVSTWRNWIGDTKQTPTGRSTVAWHLSEIRDQWDNYIKFEYESVFGKQNPSQPSSRDHTVSIHLNKVISSNGSRIELIYSPKNPEEYFEPETDAPEPDAYQEKYETKYLSRVEQYNMDNTIINSYDLGYDVLTINVLNKKRYLTSITHNVHSNSGINSFPSQEFEYFTSGTFNGGIKEVTYPTGGKVTYNYENKFLFNNSSNNFITPQSFPSGYSFYSVLVKDNYSLYVAITDDPVSGDRYRVKFFRYWWNGKNWESHEYTFPHLMKFDDNGSINFENFHSVLEDDYYGFLYDKGSSADMYLFYLNENGNIWDKYTRTNIDLGGNDHDPKFMSGNRFVSIGTKHLGKLYNYIWVGNTWRQNDIDQGPGGFYYAANNNFILTLNYYSGNDMVTGLYNNDQLYIHYLNPKNEWITRSWSSSFRYFSGGGFFSNIGSGYSAFYPGNSISGFMMSGNQEVVLVWREDYTLSSNPTYELIKPIGAYTDTNHLMPIGNNLFSLYDEFWSRPYKLIGYDGVDWNLHNMPPTGCCYPKLSFGKNTLTFQGHTSYNGIGYYTYNPNLDNFVTGVINNTGISPNEKSLGVNNEFFISGDEIFRKHYTSSNFTAFQKLGDLDFVNGFTHTNGYRHAFVEEYTGNYQNNFEKGTFLFIDKEQGSLGVLGNINLQNRKHLRGNIKLGGYKTFMSTNSMWLKQENASGFTPHLYRIINDKVNQPIYDIVVSRLDINDNRGNIRKIQYTYSNPQPTSDNSITYYGQVTTENKGFGTGNIGKITKIFETSVDDVRLTGLPKEIIYVDKNNVTIRKITNTWNVDTKIISNGSVQLETSSQVLLLSKKEELFFDNHPLIQTTNNFYNSKGQLFKSTLTNSKGQLEHTEIEYGWENYSFINDKNMLSNPYQTTYKVENEIVNVSRSVWTTQNDKVYMSESLSGPTISDLRLDSEISYVDDKGNLLEIGNGKGIYSSVLNGYDHNYEVANIQNARYQEVINELDVSYANLQNLSTSALKSELMKLYSRLPESTINLTFYDENGRVINTVDGRQQEVFVYYDEFGRVDYITDGDNNVLEKKEYNFGTN